MVPSIPTMPDLTEVIARVDKAKEWELEVDEEGVRQQALELAAIEVRTYTHTHSTHTQTHTQNIMCNFHNFSNLVCYS